MSAMLNSVDAAQGSPTFLNRGWALISAGNPHAHAILRGYVDENGKMMPNYSREHIMRLLELYNKQNLQNPAVIVDTNHANSGKECLAQIRIAKEVMQLRRESNDIQTLVKGLMIESYIEDGAQKIGSGEIYGKSITDPCLGWEKTERLIYDIADLL
jgi:3-deoxy-7-phosphoheptulonate synthase